MSARRDDDDDDVRDLSVRKGASAATSTQRSSSSSSAKNKTLVFLVRVCMWGVLVFFYSGGVGRLSQSPPRGSTQDTY